MDNSSTPLKRRRKSFRASAIFLPITIPLLLVAAAISIPWTYIQGLNQRRQERRFAEDMRKAGRRMDWQEFTQVIATGAGTVIGEYLTIKGPFRLWWTAEDVPAISPHKWNREKDAAVLEAEFVPFFEWCYARYTNSHSGAAQLIVVSEEERKQLGTMLEGARFVSTCSFRSLRERATANVRPD